MWVTAASGIETGGDVGVGDSGFGSQMRRWDVSMRIPDLRTGRLGFSSESKSIDGWRDDSISLGRRTGRPLVVVSAAGNHFPAIL